MVKLKKQGCPMDSVDTAQAWREARQNIAARKPLPDLAGANVNQNQRLSTPPVPKSVIVAREVMPDCSELGEDHQAARTRREIAEANLAEMREAEERGDLIRVSAVKATLATVFATTRDALLQIPSRLAPLLAADADPANVQNTLHTEIHQALNDLANAPAKVGQVEGLLE
jgi:hypothetical protein